jgi:hypothetical protein
MYLGKATSYITDKKKAKRVGVAIMFYTCIREVLGLNLAQANITEDSSDFFRLSRLKHGSYLD